MENRKRILVVDDEQEITLVLRSGLTKHGYDVRVAGEGEAALELFQAWTPDLVVTDLSMPNMNGLKLCQRLRAIQVKGFSLANWGLGSLNHFLKLELPSTKRSRAIRSRIVPQSRRISGSATRVTLSLFRFAS